jgi:hypothetical protein
MSVPMGGTSFLHDLIELLHEDWIPKSHKDVIQKIILDTIDYMEMSTKTVGEQFFGKR